LLINLNIAVNLKSQIGKNIQELLRERTEVSTVKSPKGEKYDDKLPIRTLAEVEAELEGARKDYRQLVKLMAQHNLAHSVKWDGEEITLTEALELSKQLRGEVNVKKSMGQRKKQEVEDNWRNPGSENIVYALYDPEVYRKGAQKLSRQVEKLSIDIDMKNGDVKFEFPAASKYIEG